jgi:hypothetical protein
MFHAENAEVTQGDISETVKFARELRDRKSKWAEVTKGGFPNTPLVTSNLPLFTILPNRLIFISAVFASLREVKPVNTYPPTWMAISV